MTTETSTEWLQAYSDLPYQTFARRSSDIQNVAMVARLRGLDVQPPSCAHVLEVGCGRGANIISMAEVYPESTFVGIDIVPAHIDEARAAAAALGISNLQFYCEDAAAFQGKNTFHYVICHGVFSWISPDIRRAMIQRCAEVLTENGIAFISYNTKPGAAFRSLVREVMLYHAELFKDPREKLREATELIRFLAHVKGVTADSYRSALHEVLPKLEHGEAGYLFHDLLAPHNRAFFLTEFVAEIHPAGLHYIGDANLECMMIEGASPEVSNALKRFLHDRVRLEQYLDFIENRSFRESLVARKEAGGFRWELLSQAYFASPLLHRPEGGDHLHPAFIDSHGREISIQDPADRAILIALTARWPESLPFVDLAAVSSLDNPDDALRRLIGRGLVEMELLQRRCVRDPGDYPATSAYARYTALKSRVVTSPIHHSAPLSDAARFLVAHMDGSRTRIEIDDALRVLLDVDDSEEQIKRAWEEVLNQGFALRKS